MTGVEPISWAQRALQVVAMIDGLSELAEVLKGAVLWGLEGPAPASPTEDEGMDVFHVIGEFILYLIGIEFKDELLARIPKDGTGKHGFSENGAKICFTIVIFIMILFTILGYLNGWGVPDDGEEFGAVESKFDDIDNILAQAKAEPAQWSSGSADRYNTKNSDLYDAVQDMGDADDEIARTLERQAGQVKKARVELESTMASLELLLGLVGGTAGKIFAANPVPSATPGAAGSVVGQQGQVAAKEVPPNVVLLEEWILHLVLAVSISAIGVAIVLVGLLIDAGRTNGRDIDRQTTAYRDAGRKAKKILGDADVAGGARVHTGPTAPTVSNWAPETPKKWPNPPLATVVRDGHGHPLTSTDELACSVGMPLRSLGQTAGRVLLPAAGSRRRAASLAAPVADLGAEHAPGVPVDIAAASAEPAQEPGRAECTV